MKRLTKEQQAFFAYGIAGKIRESINEAAQKRFDVETHSSLLVQQAIEESLLKFFDVVFDDPELITDRQDCDQ